MSQGFRHKSEMDGLLHHALNKIEGDKMTNNDVVDIARALIANAAVAQVEPPFRITLPSGSNPSSSWGKEGVTLEQRIKDLSPDVKEVVEGYLRGVSIEHVD